MTYSKEYYDQVVADERDLVFDSFTRDDAWEFGSRMRAAALEQALPIVIGIQLGPQRVFHTALDGSSADNDGWLERKTAVATRYGRSSMGVGELFRTKGQDFDTHGRLDTTRFAAHGGAFPITVRGAGVIGTVGVSGLPQKEDHAFVVEQLRAYLAARG